MVVGDFVASYCARYGAQGFRAVGREENEGGLDLAVERTEGRRTLGVGSNERLILFVSQGLSENQRLIPQLREAVSRLAGGVLVVRPHPKENLALKRLLAPGVTMSRQPSPRRALLAADVVVTVSSLMALDAALLGRRVLLTSATGVPTMAPLVAAGMARFVRPEDLAARLPQTLDGFWESPGSDSIVVDTPRRIADRVLALLSAEHRSPGEAGGGDVTRDVR